MDRHALAERNQKLARAIHADSVKDRVRSAALAGLARLPVPAIRRAPDRILLIRPDHLGDVLMTTPAIRALRQALPDAEIHALVGPWSADVLAAFDELDVVLTLPFPGFNRGPSSSQPSPYTLLARSARHLRRVGYQSAVVLRPDHWWGALLARFAGIPERIGYQVKDVGRFLTHGVPFKPAHGVVQSARLVERWTGPLADDNLVYRLPIGGEDRLYIRDYLANCGVGAGGRVIAIHPGAGTAVKLWDADRWAQVGDTLAEQLGAAVVLTGSDRERPLVREIAARMRAAPCTVVGDTALGQLAALYERADLVLGPDTGPLHVAAAVGTPTVALFGPADPALFRPWGPREKHAVLASSIACRPCGVLDWSSDDLANHPCVRDIPVGHVLEAARRIIQAEHD